MNSIIDHGSIFINIYNYIETINESDKYSHI